MAMSSTRSASDNALVLGQDVPVLAVWGGLGFTKQPLRELRDLYAIHRNDLSDFIRHCSQILRSLTQQAEFEDGTAGHAVQYDVEGWIADTSKRIPPPNTLPGDLTGAVTIVLQISRYVLLCKRLDKSPGELARCFTAFAGHSIGMTVASFMAAARSWDSLYELSNAAITGTYWGGRRATTVWNQESTVSKSIAAEFVRRGEGTPSPMLSITGLERSKVLEEVEAVNRTLKLNRKIYLSLVNDIDSFVASGGPEGLIQLCDRLRTPLATDSSDQSRIIFNQRQAKCSLQFLSNDVPFHCQHLQPAADAIREKVKHFRLRNDQLLVPVWGLDKLLQESPELEHDMVPGLVEIVLSRNVDWCKIMDGMSGAWQVLDFGPGGLNGIGVLVNRMKAGSMSKVYTVCPAGNMGETADDLLTNVTGEIATQRYSRVQFSDRRPIASSAQATPVLSRKFSEMMGLPRVLVAGMTPTTCDVDLVAAIMNAGFYAELASGGYNDGPSLAAALRRLATMIPEGRLITVNVIYANPQGLAWIVPQLASLVREGCPIGGLTIGAGVPAASVAAEYIETLELSYISFKPSSATAIHQVLEIAKSFPTLPVLLQWTGGRAGGHHSMEDFHQPVLDTYQAIREVDNVILVAGSGFGDAEGSWPYLSGEWSQSLGRPRMPFDAILLGTCVMTTQEAKTSHDAKQAMVDAAGVSNEDWPATLKGPAGGVISIISNLGEPMHVLATRGMRLWAELDETLFNKPREKMVEMLHKRQAYYIARLNSDYQKVWFAHDYATDKPLNDVSDMTYYDVLRRLLELLHPVRKAGWTHPSYKRVFDDFLLRTLERFDASLGSVVGTLGPREQLAALQLKVTDATHQYVSMEDVHYFVDICRRRGQKPVPFIPNFDTDFVVSFKKDPLWQAEDLDSTYHADVGRVCILAGPVAVQHCKSINVPVAKFLSDVDSGFSKRDPVSGASSNTRFRKINAEEESRLIRAFGSANLSFEGDTITLTEDDEEILDNDLWLSILAARFGAWGGFLNTRKLVTNGKAYPNPVRRILSARPGATLKLIKAPGSSECRGAELYSGNRQDALLLDARISFDGRIITASIVNRCTRDEKTRGLVLKFVHDASRPFAPFVEVMHDRIDRMHEFYDRVLFGPVSNRTIDGARASHMDHDPINVAKDRVMAWLKAIDGEGLESPNPLGPNEEVPIEYSTILVWPASWRHFFTFPWDVSRLLHQHTTVELREGQTMLRAGDSVTLGTKVRALYNRDSGIEIGCVLTYVRDGQPVLDVIYHFMVLGQRLPDAECFEEENPTTWELELRTEADIQALLAKPWYHPVDNQSSIQVGKTLVFELQRISRHSDGKMVATTAGKCWILEKKSTDMQVKRTLCASIEHKAVSNLKDVVMEYMGRNAVRIGEPTRLPTEKTLRTREGKAFKIVCPDNSVEYADVGGDFNPIHTITTFARFQGFKTPIYHGNHTTALVLQLIRKEIPGASAATLRKYSATNTAVVYPGDTLSVTIKHVAMDRGMAVLSYDVRNRDEEQVLVGEVTLDAPSSAFLFTGQGSQFAGMGLDLISQSKPARLVWTKADEFFEQHWGRSSLQQPYLPCN